MSENKFNELKNVNGEVDFVCLNTQVYYGLVLFGMTEEIRDLSINCKKKKVLPSFILLFIFVSFLHNYIKDNICFASLFKNKIVFILVLLFYWILCKLTLLIEFNVKKFLFDIFGYYYPEFQFSFLLCNF